MKISKQRIIANALKNSEYDLASWPEDTLNSLSDLILAALGAAEFIQTEGERELADEKRSISRQLSDWLKREELI